MVVNLRGDVLGLVLVREADQNGRYHAPVRPRVPRMLGPTDQDHIARCQVDRACLQAEADRAGDNDALGRVCLM